jgi:hypothetical protein
MLYPRDRVDGTGEKAMSPKTLAIHRLEFYLESKRIRMPLTFRHVVKQSELEKFFNEKQSAMRLSFPSTEPKTSADQSKLQRTMEIARRGIGKYHEALLELAK